jgi:hypothetical protein
LPSSKPQDVDVVLDDLAVGGRNAHQVASVSASARRPSTIYWFNNEGWTPETRWFPREAALDGVSEKLASDFGGIPLTTGGHHGR